MRATALLLILTLPSLGLAQPVTSPAYPQVEQPADAPVATTLVPRQSAPPLVEAPPTPPYARWYVWTGAGVVVTALVVTALVFATSSQHPRPLSQSDICGPSGCDACVGLSCR